MQSLLQSLRILKYKKQKRRGNKLTMKAFSLQVIYLFFFICLGFLFHCVSKFSLTSHFWRTARSRGLGEEERPPKISKTWGKKTDGVTFVVSKIIHLLQFPVHLPKYSSLGFQLSLYDGICRIIPTKIMFYRKCIKRILTPNFA